MAQNDGDFNISAISFMNYNAKKYAPIDLVDYHGHCFYCGSRVITS